MIPEIWSWSIAYIDSSATLTCSSSLSSSSWSAQATSRSSIAAASGTVVVSVSTSGICSRANTPFRRSNITRPLARFRRKHDGTYLCQHLRGVLVPTNNDGSDGSRAILERDRADVASCHAGGYLDVVPVPYRPCIG